MVTAPSDIRTHQTAFAPKVVPAPRQSVGRVHRLVPDVRPPAGAAVPSTRALRLARVCAPEHAGLVRQLCVSDPSVLPRRHPGARGAGNEHVGWRDTASDGAYSRIPVWRSRDHWLDYVVPVAIAMHPDVLARHRVDADTMRTWALVKSGYAHQRTGRCCIVRPDTLASVMGVTARHAKRCNAAAREIGLEVVVKGGRMLTWTERFRAWKMGSHQRGLSTEVALTTPQATRRIVDQVTPPKRRNCPNKSAASSGVLHGLAAESVHGLAAESEGAASPPHLRKTRRRPPGWHLAQELASTVPWLVGEGPARLAPTLSRFATSARPWAAGDVLAVIREHTLRSGHGPVDPQRIRTRPAAVLAAILRGIDPELDHPGLLEHAFDDATTAAAVPTEAPAACGHPDCDGHGWITTTGDTGRDALIPCPHCPPAIRHQPLHHHDTSGETVPGWDPEDPPF